MNYNNVQHLNNKFMDYEKKYKEALERAKGMWEQGMMPERIEYIFPELKESEDEKISKEIIKYLEQTVPHHHRDEVLKSKEWIAWLEKQGDTNETINIDEFAQGVLKGAAINLINWIDYNAAEGNMCLSNMECMDIEDAFVSSNWDKIYAYIKKKLEKQGEQNPAWSEEDEVGLGDAMWAIEQARSITKDENDMGNLWYAERWLKSIKERMKGE